MTNTERSEKYRKNQIKNNCDPYYNDKRRLLIKRLIDGSNVNSKYIKEYNITQDDFLPTTLNDFILNALSFTNNIDLTEIEDILNNTTLSNTSKKTLYSKLKTILRIFNEKLLEDLLTKFDANIISDKLISIYNNSAKEYIYAICVLYTNSNKYKSIIGEVKYNYYKFMITDLSNQYKIIQQDKIDKQEVSISWNKLNTIRKEYEAKEKYSQKHLLISLYTMCVPMRDNYGNIKLVDKNYENIDENYYCIETNTITINKYKTDKKYGAIKYNFPIDLYEIIKQSIILFPRNYLITKLTGEKYKSNKLSTIIIKYFGISIDDIRHSFETELEIFRCRFSYQETELIDKIIGHKANMGKQYVNKKNNVSDEKIEKLKIEFDTTNISIIDSISKKIMYYFG
jgi:hypothetical protein